MTSIIDLFFNLSLVLNISLYTPLACIQVCSLCVAVWLFLKEQNQGETVCGCQMGLQPAP